MADILGTAVGVVSLGIQVCNGLVQYYSAYKDYDENVKTTVSQIEDLSNILTVLQSTLHARVPDPVQLKIVEDSIASCSNGIGVLKKKLEKVKNVESPPTLREYLKSQARRMIYPFKESTLAKLRETVSELRQNLGLAIHTLQLYVRDLRSLRKAVGCGTLTNGACVQRDVDPGS